MSNRLRPGFTYLQSRPEPIGYVNPGLSRLDTRTRVDNRKGVGYSGRETGTNIAAAGAVDRELGGGGSKGKNEIMINKKQKRTYKCKC